MAVFLRLMDHNVDKATGLTVRMGRFNGSVCLAIEGTVGQLTVDANELRQALETLMNPKSSVGSKRTKSDLADRESNHLSQRSKDKKSVKRGRPLQSATPVVGDSKKAHSEPMKLAATGHNTWTPYEDRILSIYSAVVAAKKLKRPVAEVTARKDKLGFWSI